MALFRRRRRHKRLRAQFRGRSTGGFDPKWCRVLAGREVAWHLSVCRGITTAKPRRSIRTRRGREGLTCLSSVERDPGAGAAIPSKRLAPARMATWTSTSTSVPWGPSTAGPGSRSSFHHDPTSLVDRRATRDRLCPLDSDRRRQRERSGTGRRSRLAMAQAGNHSPARGDQDGSPPEWDVHGHAGGNREPLDCDPAHGVFWLFRDAARLRFG